MSAQLQSRLPLTYINIRKIIGILAMSLPVIIFLAGKVFFQGELKPSISEYYYSEMRWYFVLTLCCIGFFMFFYQGYDNTDKWLSRIAGLAAFLTAIFPTSPNDREFCISPLAAFLPSSEVDLRVGMSICNITDKIHLASAGTMFIIIACLAWFQFTKGESRTKEKKLRNIVYKVCGGVIFASIIVMASSGLWEAYFSHTVYWGEFVALLFVGITWAVKGEVLWQDSVPTKNSSQFNMLQSRQYQGYKSGLSFFVFLIALWFTVLLLAADTPPFNLFEEEAAATESTAEETSTEVITPPAEETRTLGFYSADARNILTGILFVLVVIVIFFILNHQVFSFFWPLVRRNFRADLGSDPKTPSEDGETLWALFSNQANELGVQSRFSINPKADTGVSTPTTLVPDSSYLKTFFDLLGWIFPRVGYSLRINKLSSKNSGTGLSLAVVRNDRKENLAEKTFWADEFGVAEEKGEELGKDLKVQKYLMIPAYFWFSDIVDRMDGFEPDQHNWESSAYYHLGNYLWHSDPKKGINCYSSSINFDPTNWPAYAALGRVWIEKSQENMLERPAVAIENLLLACSYLNNAINGIEQHYLEVAIYEPDKQPPQGQIDFGELKNIEDLKNLQVYFGALYNKVVAQKYLLTLEWEKKDLKVEDLILQGYLLKKKTLFALSNIQENLIQRKQTGFFKKRKPSQSEEQEAKPPQESMKYVKDQCEKMLLKINAQISDLQNEDKDKTSVQELKNHPTANWLIQFLPTLEFVLQSLATRTAEFKVEQAIDDITTLPCFEKPVNMDRPSNPDIKEKYHFTRVHYRVQYNAACFYNRLASIATEKDQRNFYIDLALDHLIMALSVGGGLVKFADKDTALDAPGNAIRKDPRYLEITGKEKSEEPQQAKMGDRSVYQRKDGKWVHKRHGLKRTSKAFDTQKEAMEDARKTLSKQGGGELVVHGEDGKIRQKDTIAPGKDPRDIKG